MSRTGSNHELLPLSPPLLHILVTLADGERHGYAILREIRSRTHTNAARDPGAGSISATIRKLLSEGAIEECRERPAPHLEDNRRRYYRLTDLGRRIATEEVERLHEVVRFAHRKFPSKNLLSQQGVLSRT
jgi:DNA-binding PadR family transcriptional regulator